MQDRHDLRSIGYSVVSVHLVITDSGLGGLSVCALLEQALRERGTAPVRLTFVNAWPEEGRGYNSLADAPSRTHVFDRALRSMSDLGPDLIVIACNTLSIVYESTSFHAAPPVRVRGIVDTGTDLFHEALLAEPTSALVVFGTRTTIESGVHRDALRRRGIATGRIGTTSCHGLATAIEQAPGSDEVASMIDACTRRASEAAPAGEPLYAALACTHYSMVEEQFRDALALHTGRTVGTLDPNARLVAELAPALVQSPEKTPDAMAPVVEVISKVTLSAAQRENVAAVLERASPATADALRDYRHVPELF
jgi:glutamate racemase